ncbi:MAG: Rieske 2Fe-2S domain-containing protein [Desulfobacterales bacterium]
MAKESDLNRRKFMEIGIYTITGTIAAVSGVALARFAVGSSFDKTKSIWIELSSEDVQDAAEGFARVVLEYEQKDGWLAATTRSLAYVKQPKEGQVIAISATCSHLGCIVTWDEEQKIFKCPCHNGRYDAQGRVISGPPPRPLKRHRTKMEDGKIFLATETTPYGGDSPEPA